MKILAIDTSNQTMAVAVTENQQLLGQFQTAVNKNHSTGLMPAIEYVMSSVNLQPRELERIIVAQGPGSYTGLRIGTTTAKTLADTLNIDLVGVSSLKVLAANCRGRDELILPLFDARRNNVYAGGYQWQKGKLVQVIADQHVPLTELLQRFGGQTVYFVGADVKKFQKEIEAASLTAIFNQIAAWDYPNALILAELGLSEMAVDSVHDFLPLYLKRVEAEEKWLETHKIGESSYVEKI